MALTVLPTVPRLIALAANTALDCRVDPFIPGQVIGIAASANATVYGAAYDKRKAKRAATLVFPSADVTAAANVVGFTATRDAYGNATGDVTITFGSADGQIVDSLPGFTDATNRLNVAVWVNGKLLQRVADSGGDPGPGQFRRSDARTIIIGADANNPIRVGSEIIVAIAENIGALASVNASTGAFETGGQINAGTMAERRLGLALSTVDTAGRSGTALVEVDAIVASAAVSVICITK